MVRVQREVRSCAGCGACCTEEYNAVRILPIEGWRIAQHLATLPPRRSAELVSRLRAASAAFGLRVGGAQRRYTCPFLEEDQTCCLPLGVKPTACLSFNPVAADACAQEPELYHRAHDQERLRNQEAGLPPRRAPIPLAVLNAGPDGKERPWPDLCPTP